MEKGFLIAVIIVGGAALLWLLSPVLRFMVHGASASTIASMEQRLRDPKVYEPVAQRLALYCQSDPTFFPDYSGSAWLAPELNAVGKGWIHIRGDEAHVEMGGGFYHFGYDLVLNKPVSSEQDNAWQLFAGSEAGRDSTPLTTVTLSKSEKLSKDQLVEEIAAEYDHQFATDPIDERAHQDRIQTYLQFDAVDRARNVTRICSRPCPTIRGQS